MTLPVELNSATTLLTMLTEGSIGSVELLDLLLERCDRLNPSVNAVVTTDIEGARIAAKAADNLPKKQRGLLHGLPMTIKDAYEVVGMTASCGFSHLAGHRPVTDADPVGLLRNAGAVFFGKTNLPLAASDHQSYNDLYGTTNNPWDPARTPGGSSGGAAAALAAGLTPLELGSDIGGSIRCPSHYCGVYGHKPSYGLVPMRGHIPPMPGTMTVADLGVGGPMARSSYDLELALDILTTPIRSESMAWSVRIPDSRHEQLRNFKVALWADQSAYPVDSRCLQAMHEYADDLRKLGVSVDESGRPDLDPVISDEIYFAMLFATVSADMPEEAIQATIDAGASCPADDKSFPARIARSMRMGHNQYLQLKEQQAELRLAWQKFFQNYDLILCPIMPTVAPPHDHSGQGPAHIPQYSRTLMVDGKPVPYLHGLQWPGLITVACLPATAVPTGRFIDGMPMGLQVVAPYLEDRTSIRFAQLVEKELGAYSFPNDYVSR